MSDFESRRFAIGCVRPYEQRSYLQGIDDGEKVMEYDEVLVNGKETEQPCQTKKRKKNHCNLECASTTEIIRTVNFDSWRGGAKRYARAPRQFLPIVISQV